MKISREVRIYTMLGLTSSVFVVELTIGFYVSSLALVADSFHMLNDLLSMIIALWAIKVAKNKKSNPDYSYGWQRAEVLSALVNSVFLLALCFTIVIHSIERFIHPEPITNPMMVLITGSVGLVANLVGLFLFHEHGHHSHGNQSESNDIESIKGHSHSEGHLNMKSIFLHVMGDALGNLGVIASALFIWLTPYSWRFYSDPFVSILIVIIIFVSAIPLVKQTSFILLQGVPSSISMKKIDDELTKLEGVVSVHELHIWQLNDHKIVASLHVLLKTQEDYIMSTYKIRQLFHDHGIHSVTVQPEFIEQDNILDIKDKMDDDSIPPYSNEDLLKNPSICLLGCSDDACLKHTCCSNRKEQSF